MPLVNIQNVRHGGGGHLLGHTRVNQPSKGDMAGKLRISEQFLDARPEALYEPKIGQSADISRIFTAHESNVNGIYFR